VALGGALVLLSMMCDLTVGGGERKILLSRARLGFTGGSDRRHRPRRIPHKVAMEMCCSCRILEPYRAAQYRLVNEGGLPTGQQVLRSSRGKWRVR